MFVLRKEPFDKNNPIVFLDISIDLEPVGRMIIELRKDTVPKTAENFRQLCTGEAKLGVHGTPLHYKNTFFHKVQRVFMAQGGDVVGKDGKSGESIYGPTFDDENFILLHEQGAVSMANLGRPNTNNSQFFVTAGDSPHLDGTNVVFGYVLRGFGILAEMDKYASDEAVPMREIQIIDCGEIKPNEPWNFEDNDETLDKLPPFPRDCFIMPEDQSLEDKLNILNSIKDAGNWFYRKNDFLLGCRKYKKAQRYYAYFLEKHIGNKPEKELFEQFHLVNCLNIAAVEIKLKRFTSAKAACQEVLQIDKQNVKALYRRGQAEIGLKNYDEAVKDLSRAHLISPSSTHIVAEYKRAKHCWHDYHAYQKDIYKNLFKYN